MSTIITDLTPEMGVEDRTISDLPDSAQRAGERIARKYRAQGWPCECVGVIAVVKSLGVDEETNERIRAGYGMVKRGVRTHYFDQTVYCPVIAPKPPCGDE